MLDVFKMLGLKSQSKRDIAMADYMRCIEAEKFLRVTIGALRSKHESLAPFPGRQGTMRHCHQLIQDRMLELEAIQMYQDTLQECIEKGREDTGA